jgi:hypothetical protein
MTQQVKIFVRNYIEDIDKFHGEYHQLNKKARQERMLLIKASITLGNELEKASIFDKMKIIYPMSHPDQTLRTIPINFKNK